MVKIRIPATSANLGSGFDALGVAVELYNYVEIEPWDSVLIESMDDIEIPTNSLNLVYEGARVLYSHLGKSLDGLHIKQWNNIPLARGLGSSSACIVGGIVAANHLLGQPMSGAEMLNFATEIEGHPDNVAPALLGGIVCAAMDEGKVWYVHQEIKSDLQFVLMIPDTISKTSEARGILPKTIDYKDACYNLSRAALMAASLTTGKYENLRVGAQDKLHQPYRLPAIPHSSEIIDYCYAIGAYASMLSGAGSTLMAIVSNNDKEFIENVRQFLSYKGLNNWQVISCAVDNIGAKIIK